MNVHSDLETPELDEHVAEDESALARYFRDLGGAGALLGPREEARLAQTIQDGWTLVWERLFSYPPVAELLASRVTQVDVRALRVAARAARAQRTRKARLALERAAHRQAQRLLAGDRDRILLDELLAQVDLLVRAPAPPGGRIAFERYRRSVGQARALAERARDEFARKNLRLVVSVARRYRRASTLAFADLIQEGNLGLLKAIDRFEVGRGFRFSTYASWWIRHAVGRALADRGRLVRQPVHLLDARARIGRVERRLLAKHGRAPTPQELASETGLTARSVELAQLPTFGGVTSLDQPRFSDDDRDMHDTFADPQAEDHSAPEVLSRRATLDQLRAALAGLRPIEAEIVRQRFGIEEARDGGRTLADIGREHGLSRERIRQIQESALIKLRKAMASANVR